MLVINTLSSSPYVVHEFIIPLPQDKYDSDIIILVSSTSFQIYDITLYISSSFKK